MKTNTNATIHIGANDGQEAQGYFQKNIPVLWIEADPNVFLRLQKTIEAFDNQKALCALVTDKDDVEYDFLRDQNNCGQSSSIFDFHLHKKMFPKVIMGESLKLTGKTLPTILKENRIDIKDYKHINMDVEGAELLVLKGLGRDLYNFETITLEASDFEARKGQPFLKDIEEFMHWNSFVKTSQRKIHQADGVNVVNIEEGNYYEVSYKNNLCKTNF